MASAPHWPPRSNPADNVVPETSERPHRCARQRCPNCDHVSLVNHCWFLYRVEPYGRNACRDLICFMCLARVCRTGLRVFVHPVKPPITRCRYARTSQNGICNP